MSGPSDGRGMIDRAQASAWDGRRVSPWPQRCPERMSVNHDWVRCHLAAGHDGPHLDGDLEWREVSP